MDICQNIQCIQQRIEQMRSKEKLNGECICKDGSSCSCMRIGKQNSFSRYSHERFSSSRFSAQSSKHKCFMCPSCIRAAGTCSCPQCQEQATKKPIKLQCIYCGDLFLPEASIKVDQSTSTPKEKDYECKCSNSVLAPGQNEAPFAPPPYSKLSVSKIQLK